MRGYWFSVFVVLIFVAAAVAVLTVKWEARADDSKIALVIGNAAYPEYPLANPVNDARAMASLLRKQGFYVIVEQNSTRNSMWDAVRRFTDRLRPDGVALFYYSGHGVQQNGKNFMLPTDFRLTIEERLPLDAMDVDVVLEQMEAARSRVNLVILDACRNNAFDKKARGVGRGLAQMDAPTGTLIAFATAPNKTASDGDPGANGVYTTQLLRVMQLPSIPVEQVFKQVRIAVRSLTNGTQVPWEASSLTGDFYFTTTEVTASLQQAYNSTSVELLSPVKPTSSDFRQPNPPPQQIVSLAPLDLTPISLGSVAYSLAESQRSVRKAVEHAQDVRRKIGSGYPDIVRATELEAHDIWSKQGGQEMFRRNLAGRKKNPTPWRTPRITNDEKFGFFLNNDGTLCETEVNKSQRHGFGVCWNPIYVYEGEFQNGFPSG